MATTTIDADVPKKPYIYTLAIHDALPDINSRSALRRAAGFAYRKGATSFRRSPWLL